MRIPVYQIDAFTTGRVFSGNPAAVCPLESWIDDSVMQAIAQENNLSETAFFVPEEGGYHLRWFTPETEVDLCGHATLASAFVIFTEIRPSLSRVIFRSKSGELTVDREEELLSLNFPSQAPVLCEVPEGLLRGLGREPLEVLGSVNYMAVYPEEGDVATLRPDMAALKMLDRQAVIATARGNDADFVSRFFAPKMGIPEDPVTGSAHCALTPYWAEKLSKKKLRARQISKRGGELFCEDRGERVKIAGRAVKFLEGFINV